MAISFPLNPNIGDEYSAAGKSWTWNGSQWEGLPPTSGIPFGETADRPANPELGQPFFNADEARLEMYTTAIGWQNIVQETPGVVNVEGAYIDGDPSTEIIINGSNFAVGCIASVVGQDGTETLADATTVISVAQVAATFSGLSATNEPYDVKVVNPSNLSGIAFDILQVDDIPVFITQSGSLGAYIEESPMSVQISVTDEEESPLVFSVSSGSLPAGLSLNTATGEISGTPTDVIPNTTSTFEISATDGNNTVTRNFSIIVNDRGPTWQTAQTLSAFSKNVAYTQTVVAIDDNDSIVNYTVNSGSLPLGLTLNSSTGEISGTSTSDASAIFTIRATDTSSGEFSDRQFTIPNPGPAWQTPSEFNLFSDESTFQLSAIDDSGLAPEYSVVSGALPPGVSLLSSGVLNGAPSGPDASTSTFTIRATDNNGAFSDRQFLVTTIVRLYAFTSHTFTAASLNGRTGPTLSQARSAYSSTSWADTYLNMSTQGIQEWTVPVSGLYYIDAYGSRGSRDNSSSISSTGARVADTFYLTGGEIIKIACGQYNDNTSSSAAGGGGGTFVVRSPYNSNDSILAIAGGGGGAESSPSQLDVDTYGDASISTSGLSGIPPVSSTGSGAGGASGNGGGAASASNSGGGGGGFFTDGTRNNQMNANGGSSWLNGLNGGTGAVSGGDGGFGGGGGSYGNGGGPGGGGGYSGGGAGDNTSGSIAGGGGSYVSGTNTNRILSRSGNSGRGYVTITKL